VLLIGDSNAGHFSETFIDAADVLGLDLGIFTSPACPFIDDFLRLRLRPSDFRENCRRFVSDHVQQIRDNPIDIVIISSATRNYLTATKFRPVFGDPETLEPLAQGEVERRYEDGLRSVVESISATGSSVVIAEVVPRIEDAGFDECSRIALFVGWCANNAPSADDMVNWRTATSLEQRVASGTGARLWRPTLVLCPGGRCRSSDGNVPLWRDPSHISVAAAEKLVPSAVDLLEGLIEQRKSGS
jgi:hypothetical protein